MAITSNKTVTLFRFTETEGGLCVFLKHCAIRGLFGSRSHSNRRKENHHECSKMFKPRPAPDVHFPRSSFWAAVHVKRASPKPSRPQFARAHRNRKSGSAHNYGLPRPQRLLRAGKGNRPGEAGGE